MVNKLLTESMPDECPNSIYFEAHTANKNNPVNLLF